MTTTVPEEFTKVMRDFVRDMRTTFPEFEPIILKWWKEGEDQEKSVKFLFKFCQKKYPPRFFDILYQNDVMFKEESDADTEFLPFIHFKNLWSFEISNQTRETIWKYLQLITFSIIGSIQDKEAFGSTASLFEAINENEFKTKIEETMKNLFETMNPYPSAEAESTDDANSNADADANANTMPNAEEIHSKILEMMGGKLGALAKEIAEEFGTNMDIDMDFGPNPNMSDVFSKLIKNPTKLMSLVKSVGTKLDNKFKSGELKESELIEEATQMMNKMKDLPGMGNIQSMLGKMGLGGSGGKVNMGAMKSQLDANLRKAKMKERMRAKMEEKQKTTATAFSTGENVERTPRGQAAPAPVAAAAPVAAPVAAPTVPSAQKKKKIKK
jgi:hypothetical protein